jgi:hypothetical protein
MHRDYFFVGKFAFSLSGRVVVFALLREGNGADNEDEQNCEGYLLQHKPSGFDNLTPKVGENPARKLVPSTRSFLSNEKHSF